MKGAAWLGNHAGFAFLDCIYSIRSINKILDLSINQLS
jgi:hypothetical protein